MGSVTQHLDWSSSEPGVYTREVQDVETLTTVLIDATAPTGHEQWAIMSAVRVSFPNSLSDPIPHLQRAWAATTRFDPLISASLSEPGAADGKRYMIWSKEKQDAWIKTTFHVQKDATSANSLFSQLKPDQTGLHWLPRTSEILMRLSHWKVDGMGSVMLWGNFLRFLAESIAQGTPDVDAKLPSEVDGVLPKSISNLFPTANDAERTADLEKESNFMINQLIKGAPSLGVPLKSGADRTTPPGVPTRTHAAFDETQTEAIIKACTEKQVSVSAMVHAALLRALSTLEQHPAVKNMAMVVPVNIRKFLPPPYNTSKQGTGVYISAYPLLVTDVQSKSFQELARETNLHYRLDLENVKTDSAGKPMSIVDMIPPFLPKFIALMTTPPPPELPTQITPMVSSLGVLENHIQPDYNCGNGEKLEVEDFFLGTEMVIHDMCLHLWTLRGKLNTGFVFNSNYQDKSAMDELLAKTRAELLKGLGFTA